MILKNPEGLEQRVAVADLTQGGVDTFKSLLKGRVELVYSDPPWSCGNEKWWRKYNKAGPSPGYASLLDAWCECAVACNPDHILIELSVNPNHHGMFFEAIERNVRWEWPLLERFECCYGSPPRPNLLFHFGNGPKLSTSPEGLSGNKMTETAFRGLPLGSGKTVADPCTGLGMTSRMAHKFGLNFVGTELNPKRLDRTISWLLKHGYDQ